MAMTPRPSASIWRGANGSAVARLIANTDAISSGSFVVTVIAIISNLSDATRFHHQKISGVTPGRERVSHLKSMKMTQDRGVSKSNSVVRGYCRRRQLLQQSTHLPRLPRECRIDGQVFQFKRIARMIEQHCARLAVIPFDVMPAFGAHGFTKLLLIARHGEGRMVPFRPRIAQQRREAMAFDPRRKWEATEIDERLI